MSKSQASTSQLKDVLVSVYNGYALVQGAYTVQLAAGRNKVQLFGLPTNIDPKSLKVDDFRGPGAVTMGPIGYRPANLNEESLRARCRNNQVTVRFGGETEAEQHPVSGRLLSLADGVAILELKGGEIRTLPNVVGFSVDELPEGLSNTPSASLTVDVAEAGEYEVNLVYRARGFSWEAEYVWVYDEEKGTIKKEGVLHIGNGSGVSYPDAQLEVAAGDAGEAHMDAMPALAAGFEMAGGAPRAAATSKQVRQTQPEDFGQVKTFRVPEKWTLDEGEAQQFPFLLKESIPVEREYRVKGARAWHARGLKRLEQKVQVALTFKNSVENGLGQPLPAGQVYLQRRNAAGKLVKCGGGYLGDKAAGEEVRLETGADFDLKAVRLVKEEREHEGQEKTLEPRRGQKKKRLQLTTVTERHCVVELFNGKKKPVEVVVVENVGNDCQLVGDSHGFASEVAGEFERTVTVQPGETAKLEYTIKQTVVQETEIED